MKYSDFAIIDAHAHMGPYFNFFIPFCEAEGMLLSMDLLNIEFAVFSSNAAISSDIVYGNDYTFQNCIRHQGRFYGYFTVNPNYPERMKDDIDEYSKSKYFAGFKIHPELSGDYPIIGEGYRYMWEFACRNNLPVLSHTYFGGDRLELFAQIAVEYPGASIMIGHGGFDLGLNKTIDLCNKYENLYLDFCPPVVENAGALKMIDRECDVNKVIFGTDSPWNDPALVVGSILFSEMDDSKKKKIMRDNFLNLLSKRKIHYI